MEEQKVETVAAEAVAVVEKKSVKELKDVVVLLAQIANSSVSALKDGKVGVEDLSLFLKLIPLLPAAVDGAAQIPAELKDVDAAEVKELADAVVANLALDNEKAALVVSKSLGVVIALADLALSLKK